MRASGDRLRSTAPEGRFDEASQRDVLELAARLQKEHFDSMSASEIEQAAIEGGMNGEFVREAIRRISASGSMKEVEEAEKPASASERAVAIAVPAIVFGVFALTIAANHGLTQVGILVFGLIFVLAIGLGGFAVFTLINKDRDSQPNQRKSQSLSFRGDQTVSRPVSLGSIATHSVVALTLVTIPFSQQGPIGQFFLLAALLPFVGGFEALPRQAFWRGATIGGLCAVLTCFAELTRGGNLEPVMWPFLISTMGVAYGAFALMGFGVMRLFEKKEKPKHGVDRSEMLAQLFELQAALDRHQETRTFVSVDVVGSSTMKASGSELEAEYSFRQYQAWVADTVRGYGGEVQLSAGDGAMAMFREPASAVAAAKRLQTDIAEFNSAKNRLAVPFQIRCGVAEGKIGIDAQTPLGQIQSPVLDRAAFLQKYAEPGSVVVTKELIEVAMPVLGSLHQREMIDGKAVYCWPG